MREMELPISESDEVFVLPISSTPVWIVVGIYLEDDTEPI